MLERIARVGRRLECRVSAACILVAGALLGGPGACHAAVIGGAAPPLRVMTFNVLHSSVRNPIGSWRVRRPRVVRTIRAARPDIACLQEVSDLQLADLTRDLPEYEILPGAPSGATTAPRWMLLLAAALAAGWLALGARARRARRACRFLRAAALTAALLAFAAVLVARFVLGGFLDSGERCPILLLRGRVAGAARRPTW
jgi:hypothetical protein